MAISMDVKSNTLTLITLQIYKIPHAYNFNPKEFRHQLYISKHRKNKQSSRYLRKSYVAYSDKMALRFVSVNVRQIINFIGL